MLIRILRQCSLAREYVVYFVGFFIVYFFFTLLFLFDYLFIFAGGGCGWMEGVWSNELIAHLHAYLHRTEKTLYMINCKSFFYSIIF